MSVAVDQLLRVNGTPLSWTSTRSLVNGLEYEGFTSIDFTESREGEYIHAQRPDGTPLGITSGLYKIDNFDFEVLVDTGEMILQQLSISASVAPLGVAAACFGDARWVYSLSVTEPAGPTITVTIGGIKIEKRTLTTQKGTEALVYKFGCKATSLTTFGAGGTLTGLPQQLASLQRSAV